MHEGPCAFVVMPHCLGVVGTQRPRTEKNAAGGGGFWCYVLAMTGSRMIASEGLGEDDEVMCSGRLL